jgi:uncharacterized protein (DUF2235 family)
MPSPDQAAPGAEAPASTPPRQLIVLCDGTNNNLTGGDEDTNVVKLAEVLNLYRDDDRLVWYDPGVGNAGELPGATVGERFRRWRDRVAGLAFGRGVFDNIAQGYRFLMQHWREGDQIYLFGFSRGAFTARSIAGMVNLFGLLPPHLESLVPTLLHIYFSDRAPQRWKRVHVQSRRLFAAAAGRMPDIHFVGVWDTVSSVGMPPFRVEFTAGPDADGKCYLHVRQALSLDEHRAQFEPRLYAQGNGPLLTRNKQLGSLVQLWFRGSHSDCGGGYLKSEAVLSDHAMAWLVAEAARVGLRIGPPEARWTEEVHVLAAVARLPPLPEARLAVVHSQLQSNPWWALTGMRQRNPGVLVVGENADLRLMPQEHPSVKQAAAPLESVWRRWRPKLGMLLVLASLPLWLVLLGGLLTGLPNTGDFFGDMTVLTRDVGDYLKFNLWFQIWQLTGMNGVVWPRTLPLFSAPDWALWWDFGFIACYAYVLAWWCSWAFARRSGLRRAGDPPSRWLNALGWALPWLVGADVAENLLSLAVLNLTWLDSLLMARGVAGLMAVASLTKLLALVGVVVLIASGFVPARELPRAPPMPNRPPAAL